LLTQLAVEVAKTMRWQLLLGLRLTVQLDLLAQVLTSRLLNALGPVRAGDIWRIVVVNRVRERPIITAGSSVVIEKVFDGLLLGCLGLAVVGTLSSTRWEIIGLGAAVLLAGFVYLGSGRGAEWIPGWKRWKEALRALQRRSVLLGTPLLSLVSLSLGLFVNMLTLNAFGEAATLATLSMMLLAGYAVGALPGLPGQLGVFEVAVAAPLIASGMLPGTSLAVALALHGVVLGTLLLGGLLTLTLGLLRRADRRSSATGTVPAP
jgi:hypothetical protein